MTLSELELSLAQSAPPEGLAPPVAALWWAAKDDWDAAHRIVMGESGADAAWVHAYLHRVEGDLDNARYWYGRARREPATGALEAEWQAIAAELVGRT
jgi:hypothetical protein